MAFHDPHRQALLLLQEQERHRATAAAAVEAAAAGGRRGRGRGRGQGFMGGGSSMGGMGGTKPTDVSVDEEMADKIARQKCGCSLCPTAHNQGRVSGFQGPFSDPTGAKDRWRHRTYGTKRDPYNKRTDLPPPRPPKDLTGLQGSHIADQNAMYGGMAAGAMSMLRL